MQDVVNVNIKMMEIGFCHAVSEETSTTSKELIFRRLIQVVESIKVGQIITEGRNGCFLENFHLGKIGDKFSLEAMEVWNSHVVVTKRDNKGKPQVFKFVGLNGEVLHQVDLSKPIEERPERLQPIHSDDRERTIVGFK